MLSCVRSKWHGKNTRNEIGFLKDFRRVNVALTRAKYSLWILGNCNVLGSDPLWDALISDIRNRNLMTESTKLEHFMEKAGTGRSMPLIEAPRARNRKNRRQRNKR
jgi:superfamily I DNA and/or RNA helicase